MRRYGLVVPAALLGMLLGAHPAHAYTLSVNVPLNPPSPASGSYTVVLSSVDNQNFTFSAYGNNDGNGSPSNPSGTPAKHSAGELTLTFFDDGLGYVRPTAASGASTTGAGFTGAAWNTLLGDGVRFFSPGSSNDIAPFGGNQLNGSFSLESARALSVDIAMQDGSQQWFAPGNTLPNVPEPASLAMIVPGGLPLGLVLLRRRKRKSSAFTA